MEDIVKVINEAEKTAAEIREKAQKQAAEIISAAEAEALKAGELASSQLKIYRETTVEKAERDAQKAYDETLAKNAAEAKKFADGVIKSAEKQVLEIVGRITG